MFRYMHSKRKSGFTLLELIVVIAVVTVLVVLAVPYFKNYLIQSRLIRMSHDARLVEDACYRYHEEYGVWPVAPDPVDLNVNVRNIKQVIFTPEELINQGSFYRVLLPLLCNHVRLRVDEQEFYLLLSNVGNSTNDGVPGDPVDPSNPDDPSDFGGSVFYPDPGSGYMGSIEPEEPDGFPKGAILETRRCKYEPEESYYGLINISNPPEVKAGDTVKIRFYFCAVDLYSRYENDDGWETWYRDELNYRLNIGSMSGYGEDQFSLSINILGYPDCCDWEETFERNEYNEEDKNFCNYNGYFKDLNWSCIEYERKVQTDIAAPQQWRVQLGIDQKPWGGTSDSIMWSTQYQVYHNGILIWELELGDEPEIDPSVTDYEPWKKLIRSNIEPWLRWNRPPPVCVCNQ